MLIIAKRLMNNNSTSTSNRRQRPWDLLPVLTMALEVCSRLSSARMNHLLLYSVRVVPSKLVESVSSSGLLPSITLYLKEGPIACRNHVYKFQQWLRCSPSTNKVTFNTGDPASDVCEIDSPPLENHLLLCLINTQLLQPHLIYKGSSASICLWL